MIYTIEDKNIIREYKVVYDEQKLRELLNKIVRECSFKVKGIFKHDYSDINYKSKPYRITKGPQLPNGDICYQDITKIGSYIEDHALYYPGCKPNVTIINASKVIAPTLAVIVASILKGNIEALKFLQAYINDKELISIDTKIDGKIETSRKIINASEVDIDIFIEVSDELKELRNNKKNGHYFNADLLRQYYFEVVNLIGYELVSETKKQIAPVKRLGMNETFGSNSNK